MKEEFKLVSLSHDGPGRDLSFLSPKRADEIRAFHKSFPMYAPTPLSHLENTAKILGLGDIHVKDESYRFGLNAFMTDVLQQRCPPEPFRQQDLQESDLKCRVFR